MRCCAPSPAFSARCRSILRPTRPRGAGGGSRRSSIPSATSARSTTSLSPFPRRATKSATRSRWRTGRTSAASWSRRCASTASSPSPSASTSSARTSSRRYKDKLGAAVGVSLHMGNWELAILPFTWAGANPAAVYRSVTNPYVDRYLRDQRKDLYPDGLFGRGNVGEHGDDQNGARHHGLRAPRRTARTRVRSLRPHRHARALLRQAMPRRKPSAP